MKNGLWSPKRGGKDTDGDMSQYSEFREKENSIVLSDENDDFVAVFFL